MIWGSIWHRQGTTRTTEEIPVLFLDVENLAKRWGTTEKTIYGLRYRGQAPPAIKVGRGLRFAVADVERWEAQHRDNGSSKP
jgi:predicted DNA-binding transcriptional regulator AlpA